LEKVVVGRFPSDPDLSNPPIFRNIVQRDPCRIGLFFQDCTVYRAGNKLDDLMAGRTVFPYLEDNIMMTNISAKK
jgi:hypothetical protein